VVYGSNHRTGQLGETAAAAAAAKSTAFARIDSQRQQFSTFVIYFIKP
jgi:hypothetical protein